MLIWKSFPTSPSHTSHVRASSLLAARLSQEDQGESGRRRVGWWVDSQRNTIVYPVVNGGSNKRSYGYSYSPYLQYIYPYIPYSMESQLELRTEFPNQLYGSGVAKPWGNMLARIDLGMKLPKSCWTSKLMAPRLQDEFRSHFPPAMHFPVALKRVVQLFHTQNIPKFCRMRIAVPKFSRGNCNVTIESPCVSMNHDFLAWAKAIQ